MNFTEYLPVHNESFAVSFISVRTGPHLEVYIFVTVSEEGPLFYNKI